MIAVHLDPDRAPSSGLTVLVLGVGGNVSQGIQKALALSELPHRTLAACISADSAGLYLADHALLSPEAADPAFLPWLMNTCERESVDAVLSGVEPVLAALAPAAEEIRQRTGATCVVSSPETLDIGHDKLHTCRWLEERGLPVPGYADGADEAGVRELAERCGYPLVVKPRRGKGSDGVRTIAGADELDGVIGDPRLVVQERLGDESGEYTAGCFCDDQGRLASSIVLRRELRAGTTYRAELGDFPDVAEVARAIVSALAPRGPCNVQLRRHHGQPVPFELNVRFSGTTPARARLGFNEVEAALRHFVLGEPAPRLDPTPGGLVLRYWNEVYVPPGAAEQLRAAHELDAPAAAGAHVEDWGMRR